MTSNQAERALLRRAILDALIAADKTERALLQADMKPGDKRNGWTDDGADLGVVYVTKPKPFYRVVDPDAFTRWVSEHVPNATYTRVEVADWFAQQIKREGAWVDKETGEVLVPDGVDPDPTTGSANLTVKVSEAAEAFALEYLGRLPQLGGSE